MMYDKKLAVAIKANGKILREFQDIVYVPFGTEFSILIKNLNSVRVAVSISIDGTSATDSVRLIVNPNDDVELTRYIRNGNLTEGNRFKFIERTVGIEQHRGIKIDDGLVRIEYEFERPVQLNVMNDSHRGFNTLFNKGIVGTGGYSKSFDSSFAPQSAVRRYSSNVSSGEVLCSTQPTQNAGITVPGSVSNQQFTQVNSFRGDGTNYTMVLRLMGEGSQGTPITKAVNVETKPKCTTCGTTNRAVHKFCSNCGTSLQIV